MASRPSRHVDELNILIATNPDSEVKGEDIWLAGELSKHFEKATITCVPVSELAQELEGADPLKTVVWFGNACDFEEDEDRIAATASIIESHRIAEDRNILILPTPSKDDPGRTGKKERFCGWSEPIDADESDEPVNLHHVRARQLILPTAQNMDDLERIMKARNFPKPEAFVLKPVDGESAKGLYIENREHAIRFLNEDAKGRHIIQPYIPLRREISIFFLDGVPILSQRTGDYDLDSNRKLYHPRTANIKESQKARFDERWLTLVAEQPHRIAEIRDAQILLALHRPTDKEQRGLIRVDLFEDIDGRRWLAEVDNMPTSALDAKHMISGGLRFGKVIETGEIGRLGSLAAYFNPGLMPAIVKQISDSIVWNMKQHLNPNLIINRNSPGICIVRPVEFGPG